ncbi:ABC transporter ATP-binding protein [Vibrio sp. 10N.222.54.B12]|uniref:ABC transporter ATP-binding protein n=1 Tax=Vibrio TaxID=662 RepID=UPI0002E5F6D8|nr:MULTISPECIES: ABC transporter ATP-binding protein [Vibrio]ANP75674.1 sugar ABC transporter ATP-binding protein [Vibrio crassostreae 9CS106]NOH92107.1 ABC transporter ATP-binding protein [Vibrio sp. AIC-3]OED81651.1 sugar ABC transporter ATP-binding protein [Vibrio crassostreae ZF-91]OEE89108.1 sugar ABC transporter ATP-binding protein [Vibrio crassostreae 9ZC88]PMK20981.1 sugar ABC transporter ATP-binding protein [Vibrio sp. 10N.261.54.C3]
MSEPLISIRNLCVDYITESGDVRACNNVSFDIAPGEVFGLAGESGCGKSTVAFSLMRLHKPPAYISGGEVIFNGENILEYSDDRMQSFRWSEMSMVFQSAMNALNPVLPMEEQFCDVIMRHTNMTREQAKQRAEGLLEIVDIHPSRLSDYPHQFSGGMRQRLVIAIALALNPKLIIMDEPTTALDVVVQREILQKIYALKEEFGFSILFITHDLSLMVEFSDRIGIMYSGELIEVANSQDILENPYHPYTKGLGNSFPPLTGPKTKLAGIPGNPLNLLEIPEGCRFQARCDRVHEKCTKVPTKLRSIDPGHLSNCHLYGDPIVQRKL